MAFVGGRRRWYQRDIDLSLSALWALSAALLARPVTGEKSPAMVGGW